MISDCPSCKRRVQVPYEMAGLDVQCPFCRATFTVADEPVAPASEAESEHQSPRRGRRRIVRAGQLGGKQQTEGEKDYPASRQSSRLRADAMAAVKPSARALLVLAAVGLALHGFGLLSDLFLVLVGHARESIYLRMGLTLLGVFVMATVLRGSLKMLKLKDYAFVRASVFLAMIPCTICFVVGLPLGVVALIVLNRPEVKEAFD